MNFSVDHLESFVAAAECGSFSAAGRRLQKAQSAVSTAVANLEIDTGVQLFDRRGKYPVLTCEGEILLRDARIILARCSEFQNRAYAFGEEIDARICLGIDEIIPQNFLIDLLQQFNHQFPETELEILYGTLKDIQTMVEQGRADMGLLVPLTFPDQCVMSRLLTYMTFSPVVAANHPLAEMKQITPADLSPYRQLVITSRGGERELEEVIYSSRPWMIESTVLIHDLVRKGVGYSFLPRYLVDGEINAGTLVHLPLVMEKNAPQVSVFSIWPAARSFGKAGQWLLEELSTIECG
ncbi:MAG: LysR family transcriptional regulator [Desulfuromonas sp.]|nr:LysR family transcriptional regulator [Desulfuromonas sp.]